MIPSKKTIKKFIETFLSTYIFIRIKTDKAGKYPNKKFGFENKMKNSNDMIKNNFGSPDLKPSIVNQNKQIENGTVKIVVELCQTFGVNLPK